MKKKTITLLLVGLVALSGCAGSKRLTGTTWFNLSTVTEEGVKGTVLSGIEFGQENKATMSMSAVVDTVVVAAPVKVAEGVYRYGNGEVVKKNLPISFSFTNLSGETSEYDGVFVSKKRLDVVAPQADTTKYTKLTKGTMKKAIRKTVKK